MHVCMAILAAGAIAPCLPAQPTIAANALLTSACCLSTPHQSNKLAAALEDACDEAALLRTKAGLPPGTALDTRGIKLQKDVTIAQLRSINALLERQVRCWACTRACAVPCAAAFVRPADAAGTRVLAAGTCRPLSTLCACMCTCTSSRAHALACACMSHARHSRAQPLVWHVQVSDLEEERRKLLLEAKFRAKYHGRMAAELGLSPEQLLLLDEFVEGLRGGRLPEERLVVQMQKRVRAGCCLHCRVRVPSRVFALSRAGSSGAAAAITAAHRRTVLMRACPLLTVQCCRTAECTRAAISQPLDPT